MTDRSPAAVWHANGARRRLQELPARVAALAATEPTSPAQPPAQAAPSLRKLHLKTITGKSSGRVASAFYGVVLSVALVGSGTAAMNWLRWPLPHPYDAIAAFAAVGAAEFGGVVLSMHADERGRLGERALAARLLSAAFAGMAVAVNWFGHDHVGLAAFFAGFSLLGYLVYLLISSAKRRDYLRAAGQLAEPPPVYGLGQWLRQPALTRQARMLASADPSLGRLGSLVAARESRRAEARQAAIADALRRRLAEAGDATWAEIVVNTYDPEEIAKRIAAAADYDRVAEIISADLTPERVAAPAAEGPDVPAWKRALLPPELVADVPGLAGADVPPVVPADVPPLASGGSSSPRAAGSSVRKSGGTVRRKKRAEVRPRRTAEETRKLAAEIAAAEPDLTQAQLAERLGISARQLRNVLSPTTTPDTPKE